MFTKGLKGGRVIFAKRQVGIPIHDLQQVPLPISGFTLFGVTCLPLPNFLRVAFIPHSSPTTIDCSTALLPYFYSLKPPPSHHRIPHFGVLATDVEDSDRAPRGCTGLRPTRAFAFFFSSLLSLFFPFLLTTYCLQKINRVNVSSSDPPNFHLAKKNVFFSFHYRKADMDNLIFNIFKYS